MHLVLRHAEWLVGFKNGDILIT